MHIVVGRSWNISRVVETCLQAGRSGNRGSILLSSPNQPEGPLAKRSFMSNGQGFISGG